jgi:cytochrome c biogenesis protein CcmG, thiol:disulfide interchange protein DsbE
MASENPVDEAPQHSLWRKRALVGAGVALVVGLVVFLLLKPAPEPTRSATTGRVPAPEFTLPLLSGDGDLSSAELKGRPLVINFWGSWCEPCKEELPAFERVYGRYEGEVEFVGINMKDNLDDARAMAEDFGLSYPLVVGETELEQEFNLVGYPTTVFITSDYELMDSEIEPDEGPTLLGGKQGGTSGLGAIDEDELVAEIERLIEQSEGE